MSFPKVHIFVCTNAPDKPGKCGHKGGADLRMALKDLAAKETWAKDCRVNASGCLGQCESGIAAVTYPQGEWQLNLKSTDTDVLLNSLRQTFVNQENGK